MDYNDPDHFHCELWLNLNVIFQCGSLKHWTFDFESPKSQASSRTGLPASLNLQEVSMTAVFPNVAYEHFKQF